MSKPFKLPKAFIKQLKEFTNGFHFICINSENQFETYAWYPDEVSEMALLNYLDIQSTTMQEIIRQQSVDRELPEEEEENGSEPSL